MQWRPEPEQASAWSAVGGVVVAVTATSAVVLATQPLSAHVPVWLVRGLATLALAGFYGMLAPLLKWWPWNKTSAAFGGRTLPKRVKGEQVNLAVLDPSRAILGCSFKRCEVFGAVKVAFGECSIDKTKWDFPKHEVIPDGAEPPPGTVCFYGCDFEDCVFSGFTAVGPCQAVTHLIDSFKPGPAR
jgi:hypothetical protein